jgi:hypothetical protein
MGNPGPAASGGEPTTRTPAHHPRGTARLDHDASDELLDATVDKPEGPVAFSVP